MNIVTLFLALSILVAIILICFSDRKKVKQFDERQLIVRGRAVNLAYVTLLICMASPVFFGHPRYAFPIMFTLPYLILWFESSLRRS